VIAIGDAIRAAAGLYATARIYRADMDAMVTGSVVDTVGTPGDLLDLLGTHELLPFDFPRRLGDEAPIRVATYDGWATYTVQALLARAVCAFALRWEPPVMPAGADLEVGDTAAWAAA
jgi:hypothetical protein